MLPWKLRKRQILPVNQNFSSVYFSLAKFQPVSCKLSLTIIWQMTRTHKLPKLCSDTLIPQGQGLRFPCYDQTEKVHRRPESAINLNQQLVSRQLKKITSFQWVVQLGLWYTQVTLVSGHPFWELSIDRNIDVHKG